MTFIKRKRKKVLKLKVAQFKGVITSRATAVKTQSRASEWFVHASENISKQAMKCTFNKGTVILMELYMDPLRIEWVKL